MHGPTPRLTRNPKRLLLSLLLLCSVLSLALPAAAAQASTFDEALARGPLVLALSAFGFGALVSLTPCVYPMVAITVSVFGATNAKSRLQAFALSAAFVLGLVAMFTPLGVTAALTGKTFGSVLSNAWVVVGLSGFFLALAASMFGAFELDLPSGLKNRLASAGGAGYAGAFILGMVCGAIAAPCTGPFLWGLLAWIAQTQSVVLGTVAMSTFAAGLGLPFFLVGAFAMQLPKSGRWMNYVKSLMGIILIVVALYFLGNAFPALKSWASRETWFLVTCAVLVVLGLGMGAVHRSFEGSDWGTRLLKGVGVGLVAGSSFGFIVGFNTPVSGLAWEAPEAGQNLTQLVETARAKALTEGKPLLMDFTADWCAACKEIERRTFPDERVQEAAGRYISVKLDMTNDSDPAVERTFERFGIRGLPTLILFDSAGEEAKRFFGDFVGPEELSSAMNAVR